MSTTTSAAALLLLVFEMDKLGQLLVVLVVLLGDPTNPSPSPTVAFVGDVEFELFLVLLYEGVPPLWSGRVKL